MVFIFDSHSFAFSLIEWLRGAGTVCIWFAAPMRYKCVVFYSPHHFQCHYHFICSKSQPSACTYTPHKHHPIGLFYVCFSAAQWWQLARSSTFFYHFNFITILIANNDLKNEKKYYKYYINLAFMIFLTILSHDTHQSFCVFIRLRVCIFISSFVWL